MKNPHFDEGIVIWKDEYSGLYQPPTEGYYDQFELQWKIALKGDPEYYNHPGASIEDEYIADRIYEWTGKHPNYTDFYDKSGRICILERPLPISLIKGKNCIDIACGMGRWTKTMLSIGAKSILSVDISESALKSVQRFNPNTKRINIMSIPEEYPELVGQFEFANFWGVAMCTHDPLKAFMSAASTVKSGGALYLMVYAPEGNHAKPITNIQRKEFFNLKTVEERLQYVSDVCERTWNINYPLTENLKNVARNLLHRPKSGKINTLDMLEPFYNWVIPLEVIYGWMEKAKFEQVIVLNPNQEPKCAHHVLGIKS